MAPVMSHSQGRKGRPWEYTTASCAAAVLALALLSWAVTEWAMSTRKYYVIAMEIVPILLALRLVQGTARKSRQTVQIRRALDLAFFKSWERGPEMPIIDEYELGPVHFIDVSMRPVPPIDDAKLKRCSQAVANQLGLRLHSCMVRTGDGERLKRGVPYITIRMDDT